MNAEPSWELFDADGNVSSFARQSDPWTSHAAVSIHLLSEHRRIALEALRAAGERGLNDFELAEVTGLAQTSIGKRRGDLVKLGLVDHRFVIDPKTLSLIPDVRPSPSGKASMVWVAVDGAG